MVTLKIILTCVNGVFLVLAIVAVIADWDPDVIRLLAVCLLISSLASLCVPRAVAAVERRIDEAVTRVDTLHIRDTVFVFIPDTNNHQIWQRH